MVYGDVCSGISAPSAAWHGLGWRAAFYAEVARFPSSVLRRHYPDTPNHGDFTTIQPGDYEPIDLLVGGTPCQDFSVAGLRAGMDGARGQLTVEFARLAGRLRPRWLVWENVPGVLSIDGGRAFGVFLGMLGQLGYGFAYRVLDAQHFGVPQRRRRVFVVGHLGDWRRAAAVLFERHSLSWDTPPRRKAGQSVTYDVAPCLGASGRGFERAGDTRGQDYLVASTGDIAHCLNAGGMGRQDYETETLVAHALRGDGFDASEDGTGRGTPLVPVGITIHGTDGTVNVASYTDIAGALRARVPGGQENSSTTAILAPVAFDCKASGRNGFGVGDVSPTLRAMGHADTRQNAGGQVAVAVNLRGRDGGSMPELSGVASLRAADGGRSRSYLAAAMAVRRLTPRECERLQGFPDDYTLISPKTADGPRYKALGNSMAVPVMRWIGERIQMVEDMTVSTDNTATL